MPAHTGPNQGLRYGYTVGEDGWGPAATADLKRLDALLVRAVKNRTTNTPPGSPSDGDRYIVGPSPTGVWAGKANQIAAYDAEGGAWLFYVPAPGWNVVSLDDGATYVWNGVAWLRGGWVNAAHFDDIQDAVDSLGTTGGVVFVPAGYYHSTSKPAFTGLVLPATGAVHVMGEGVATTTLQGEGATSDFVTIKGSYSSISNLSINGNGADGSSLSNGGAGIVIGDAAGNVRQFITVRDVVLNNMPRFGIYFVGEDGTGLGWGGLRSEAPNSLVIHTTIERVNVTGQSFTPSAPASMAAVVVGQGTTTTWIKCCNFSSRGYQVLDFSLGMILKDTTLEPHFEDAACVGLGLTLGGKIDGCHFENAYTPSPGKHFIECLGVVGGLSIDRCFFAPSSTTPKVFLSAPSASAIPCRAVVISNCTATTSAAPTGTDDVSLRNAADQCALVDCIRQDTGGGNPSPWRVSVTSGGARLTRTGNDRFKLPALTTTERDALADPLAGDLIFNTTTGSVQRHNGTSWANVP